MTHSPKLDSGPVAAKFKQLFQARTLSLQAALEGLKELGWEPDVALAYLLRQTPLRRPSKRL